ncbi:MAG: peptidyl-prolyl cis-trans isomerase [Endozoicomonadaceae bacterium]|nr:peptidyl-prolyl cis-trans isomerase [Endozoicomonadaceae bacterium]
MVILHTTFGDITLKLDADKAPGTVKNFLEYVKKGHYDNTVFHRVINGFMIQCGGFSPDMQEKTSANPINNEADNGLKNVIGSIAMARTSDPHSATAQFFINVADNEFLNHTVKDDQGWGYTVFGQVIDGMDVVEKIKAVQTDNHGFHQDVPKEEIIIKSAEKVESTVIA